MEVALAVVLFYSLQTNQRGGNHHITYKPPGNLPYKWHLERILRSTHDNYRHTGFKPIRPRRYYGHGSHANMPLDHISEAHAKAIYSEVFTEHLELRQAYKRWAAEEHKKSKTPLALRHVKLKKEGGFWAFQAYIHMPHMIRRYIEENYDKDTGVRVREWRSGGRRRIPDVVQIELPELPVTEIN